MKMMAMLRKWWPLTPGTRHRLLRDQITSGDQRVPVTLRRGEARHGGRNHHGKITCRHRGGGSKGLFRKVTGMMWQSRYTVLGIQRSPSHRAPIALLRENLPNGVVGGFLYVVAGDGLKVGDVVGCGTGSSFLSSNNRVYLGDVPEGTTVYDIGRDVGGLSHGTMVKAPGAFATVRSHDDDGDRPMVLVEMPSGDQLWLRSDHYLATIGRVACSEHYLECDGKAGRVRGRGRRPTVRGCAMNPVDHPHGGRTKGGRHDVTPWARIAKGQGTSTAKGKGYRRVVKGRRG